MTEKPPGYDTKWLLDQWQNNPNIPKDSARSIAFTETPTTPQDPFSHTFITKAVLQAKGDKGEVSKCSPSEAKATSAKKESTTSSSEHKGEPSAAEYVAYEEDKEVIRLLRLTQSRLVVIGAMIADIHSSDLFFDDEDDDDFDPADKAFVNALVIAERKVAENIPRIRNKWMKFETLHDRYAKHYGRHKLDKIIWDDAELLERMVSEIGKNSLNYNYDEPDPGVAGKSF